MNWYKWRYGLFLFPLVLKIMLIPANAAMPSVSEDASIAIHQVHVAALKRNTVSLKLLMLDNFEWSFGPDQGAKQALAAWTKDPIHFKQLARVTAMPCSIEGDVVECPHNAGMGYRAGFKMTTSGWRMIYFLAGD